MVTNWSEVDTAWAQSERGGEASGHAPYGDELLDQIDAWERDRVAYELPERDDEIVFAGEDGLEP